MLVKTMRYSRGKKRYKLLFMAAPFMIIVVMFHYMPLVGWFYTLFDYVPGVPLLQCDFVGLKYFKMVLTDVNTLRVLKNTMIFGTIGILLSPLPLLFAITLNEVKCSPIRRLVQTFTTLPNFISWVIIFSLAFAMFASDGLMNGILSALGKEVNPSTAYNVMADGKAVYWFQAALGLWKSLGWSSIIYLAAITGIDQELYSAAKVDGAGRFRCALHVTIPAMAETYFVLLVLSIGNFLNTGFEQYLLFKNPMTGPNIEVIDLYVYRIGLEMSDYSYGIAIGIMKFLVSVSLLIFANLLSKRVRGKTIL